MKILLIRHGIAQEREFFSASGKADAQRPLTEKGIKKMKLNADGIKTLVPEVDLLLSSPLKRAIETRQILKKKYSAAKEFEIDELCPGRHYDELLNWVLKNARGKENIAMVGHEPHLSGFAAFCLRSEDSSILSLKKGALCIIEFPSTVSLGRAKIKCFLQPAELRKIKP